MNLKNADYDFKDQVETFRNCGNDHLYKFLVYKSDASPFDCDRSEYAKEIYQCLWGFDPEGYNFQNITVGNKSILMGMDTINSFWTTFAWSLNRWCKNDLQKYFGISYVNANSIPYFLQNYGALVHIIKKNLSEEIYQMFQAFAKLTHTLGNFTLVPKKVQPHIPERQSFNQARASKWNDYFDLSLLWLKTNMDPDWGEETFRAYIDRFFLNGYVTQQYQIVGFTPTHQQILSGNQNLDNRPQTKQELLQYLQVVCSLIQQRGNRMYQILSGNQGKNMFHTEQETFQEKQKTNHGNRTSKVKQPKERKTLKEKIHLWFYSLLGKISGMDAFRFNNWECLGYGMPLFIVLFSFVNGFVGFLVYVFTGGYGKQIQTLKDVNLLENLGEPWSANAFQVMIVSRIVVNILLMLEAVFVCHQCQMKTEGGKGKYMRAVAIGIVVTYFAGYVAPVLTAVLHGFSSRDSILAGLFQLVWLVCMAICVIVMFFSEYRKLLKSTVLSMVLARLVIPVTFAILENIPTILTEAVFLLFVGGVLFFIIKVLLSGGAEEDPYEYGRPVAGKVFDFNEGACVYVEKGFFGSKSLSVKNNGFLGDQIGFADFEEFQSGKVIVRVGGKVISESDLYYSRW